MLPRVCIILSYFSINIMMSCIAFQLNMLDYRARKCLNASNHTFLRNSVREELVLYLYSWFLSKFCIWKSGLSVYWMLNMFSCKVTESNYSTAATYLYAKAAITALHDNEWKNGHGACAIMLFYLSQRAPICDVTKLSNHTSHRFSHSQSLKQNNAGVMFPWEASRWERDKKSTGFDILSEAAVTFQLRHVMHLEELNL